RPPRGFQSSVDYVLSFGLGARDTVDSLIVAWPGRGPRDARVSVLRSIKANQRVTMREAQAVPTPAPTVTAHPLFADVTRDVAIPFAHHENEFSDFDREPLMPNLVSTEAPARAVAGVNADGLGD